MIRQNNFLYADECDSWDVNITFKQVQSWSNALSGNAKEKSQEII